MARAKNLFDLVTTRTFLNKVGGEFSVELAKICDRKAKSKRPVTDETIGKELRELKITEIRTILNRLHYRGIAQYQKTRDAKTGWYNYSWAISKQRILELILAEQGDGIGRLERKIEFEKNYAFFSCGVSCDSIPFEVAAEYNFKCPNCGRVMNAVDNKRVIGELRRKIRMMRSETEIIQRMV